MKKKYCLFEYADLINGGSWSEKEYASSGIRVVKVTNMVNGTIDDSSMSFLPNSLYEKYKINRLLPGDLVIATVGSHPNQPNSVVGRTSVVPQKNNGAFLNQNSVCVRVREKGLVASRYLTYLSRTVIFHNFIESRARGSANQVRLAISELRKFTWEFPTLIFQRKIAAVLSAYDDLIENNNRRIAILEKMAEELYREWFVRLRFPGHEKTKIIKGIPEGWELPTVEKAFDFLGGGTPSTSVASYWQAGTIDWYSPTDLTASEAIFSFGSKQKITDEGLKRSSARLFPAYSIMLTSRATIGQISINTTPATTNQGFITCIPNKKATLCYLFYWLKLNKEYFVQLSNGATFLELTKGRFKKISILIPAQFILKQFESQIQPIFNAIEKLLLKNDKLILSRDKLLSRLMSGKIDLENLDIQFPASMQEGE